MLNQLVRVTAGVVALSMVAPAFAGVPFPKDPVGDVVESFVNLPKMPQSVVDAELDIKKNQAVIEQYKAEVEGAGAHQTKAIAAYDATPSRLAVRAAAATAGLVGDAAIATAKFAARQVFKGVQEAAELSLAYTASQAYGYQAVDAVLATAAAIAAPVAGPAVLGTISGLRAMNTASEWIPGVREVKHAGLALVGTHYVLPVAKSAAGLAYDAAPVVWNATKSVASSAWNAVSSGWNAFSNYYAG
jgi:hypothetical protein